MKFSATFTLKLAANFKLINFLRNCSSSSNRKPGISYLYPHRESQAKIVTLVKPHVTSVLSREDMISLKKSLRYRDLPDVDLDALNRSLTELPKIVAQINEVEKARASNTTLVNELLAKGSTRQSIEHMFTEGQTLRSRLKELTNVRHQLEDESVPVLLQLPNKLHASTPLDSSRVTHVHLSPPQFDFPCRDHITIGRLSGTLDFEDVTSAYYLRDRAALLELAVQDMLMERFEDAGFGLISNPDFCKLVVSEGCGMVPNDPSETLWLEPDQDSGLVEYHLTGSASLPAFCAYFTKQVVAANRLPLKFFASGRRYRPPATVPKPANLFNTCQAVETHFFSAGNSIDSDRLYEESVLIVKDALQSVGELHFRMVEVNAGKLHRSNSRKTEFQLWSPFSGCYHTVSSVAMCGDFISKRLWLMSQSHAGHDFLHVVHGTALSVPVLLACLMENFQTPEGNFTIPKVLHSYMLTANE